VFDFLHSGIRKERKKQTKLKRQVKDVQALHRSARGGQVGNLSDQLAVNRAAARLGLNPGMRFNTKVR
jgi:hypothetical protein